MEGKRLFFALWPDGRQREALRDILSPLVRQVEGQAVPRANWHVTLVFIGSVSAVGLPALVSEARRTVMEPVRLRFDRFTYWQRPRIACLQATTVPPPLERLVGALTALLARLDVEIDEGNYRPHLTAVRKARAFEPVVLARPLELEFSAFELVESVATREGVEYRPLKQELPGVS